MIDDSGRLGHERHVTRFHLAMGRAIRRANDALEGRIDGLVRRWRPDTAGISFQAASQVLPEDITFDRFLAAAITLRWRSET